MSERVPLNEHALEASQRRRRLPPEDIVEAVEIAPEVSADPNVIDLEERRRNRKPFGSLEQKLQWPERQGYHRHWFNDEPGRLIRAREAGYEQVNDDNGVPVHCVVGIGRGGQALTAYLHEIPLDWYLEDMRAQEESVLELKRQIERGEFERPGGVDGRARYAGSNRWGDISIRESTRR